MKSKSVSYVSIKYCKSSLYMNFSDSSKYDAKSYMF